MNILIITSSGGGGLLQSAIAIEDEEKRKDPHCFVVKRDMLIDWIKGGFGYIFSKFYNWTQKSGNVSLQNLFVKCNCAADFVFFPFVFWGALYSFFRYRVDKVYNNQPVAISAVMKAMRVYGFFSKKKLFLNLVLVDLPTKEYSRFLKGISRFSKRDKDLLKIITIKPLLDGERSSSEYWERYCGISEENVIYNPYVIRRAFKNYQKRERCVGNFDVWIRSGSLEERALIKSSLDMGDGKYFEEGEKFRIRVEREDLVFVVLLGSKPAIFSTTEYAKGFIEFAKKNSGKNCFLFIFCGKFLKRGGASKVYNLIDQDSNFPKNLRIVPMSFQKDDVIASLFHRSDLSITRSGGHTIMELMAVSSGKKWIHSEAKGEDEEALLKGMPFWEAGNARYLKRFVKGAGIVSPFLFRERLRDFRYNIQE